MAVTYKPNGLSIHILDNIPALFDHPDTKVIKQAFKGKTFLCKLPGGELYFESKLALDADGSPAYHKQDPTSQVNTAARDSNNKSLDADRINYFVLPGGFFAPQGIRKGDIGVVIFGVQKAFACFGDVGPAGSLGEGSIALHRDLGHETIIGRHTVTGGRMQNQGISRGVITIVFPKSGNGQGRTNQESASMGAPLFERLKRQATIYSQLIDI